ncbi:MAG: flippase-like domain-containing protein [Candidatus Aenigmarchaeota archaeon]|nr:flippase-like domain-containing protein [Candidatus Aenigmarchaeota archaeon]
MLTKMLFAIGIILIALVMSFFGFKEVVDVMTMARLDYIALAIGLQFAILLLLALRLILLSRKYQHLGFVEAFKVSMSGMAVSMITPIAKIGGEPLKIYLLKKKLKGSQATAVIAVDTLAELASSLLVVFLVFMLFAREIPGVLASSFAIFLVVIAAIIILGLKLLLNPRWMRKLVNWTTRRISRFAHVKKKDYAELFYNAFQILIRDRSLVAGAFGVSFVTKLLEFARMWLVFAAISVFLPADVIVIVWSVILVLYLVPWLPGSLGLVEFFGAGALVFFGLTSSAAAGGLLLDRFISYWFVLILGLAIMTTMPLPKRLKK